MTGSVLVIILIIGCTSWMYLARIVRANILSLRERDYVSAATALGASGSRLIINHLLPNTTAPLVVAATRDGASVRFVGALEKSGRIARIIFQQEPPLAVVQELDFNLDGSGAVSEKSIVQVEVEVARRLARRDLDRRNRA